MKYKSGDQVEIQIISINEKGFGKGMIEDQNIEVLGVLPTEMVEVELYKRQKGCWRAKLIRVIEPSLFRINPQEYHFTSCSPLQIATFDFEQAWKKEWIKNVFQKNNIKLNDFDLVSNQQQFGYRNKVEFGFYSDDNGLHLSVHMRASIKGKIPVNGCVLAPDLVNQKAEMIKNVLENQGLVARDLKGMVMRYSFDGDYCNCAIYYKNKEVDLESSVLEGLLDEKLRSIAWIYSDHRAPDNRVTEITYILGDSDMSERVGDTTLTYPFDGFFQVNPRMFSELMNEVKSMVLSLPNCSKLKVIDLYAGVGTIGIILAPPVGSVIGAEIFEKSRSYAYKNAAANDIHNFEFHQLASENIPLDFIQSADVLIVDPPRSGIFPKVISKIKEALPEYIIYVSCNPATQSQNIEQLAEYYNLVSYKAFNLYPRSLHVEGIALLRRIKD